MRCNASSLADNEVFKQTRHFGFRGQTRHRRPQIFFRFVSSGENIKMDSRGPGIALWTVLSCVSRKRRSIWLCHSVLGKTAPFIVSRAFDVSEKPFWPPSSLLLKGGGILRMFETSKIQHTSKQRLSKKKIRIILHSFKSLK
jgi:hypothetical protein